MGWFNSVVSSIGKVANKTVHDVESAATTVADDVTTAANTVADGVTTAANTVAGGVTTAVTAVGNVTVEGADAVAEGVTTAADTLAKGGSEAFEDAVNAGETAFDDVRHSLEKAMEAGELAIIGPAGKKTIEELKGLINEVKSAWDTVSSELSSEVEIIRSVASGKQISDRAKSAMSTICKHPEMGSALGGFFAKSYASFGIEFGGSVAAGVGGEAALGIVAGLPDLADIRGYGSVGLSVGAEAGAEGDVALVFNLSSPEDSGGAYVSLIFSLEVDVGGTVVVSFNLPDFSLGGISIGLGAGEEAGIAVGGGYTFIF